MTKIRLRNKLNNITLLFTNELFFVCFRDEETLTNSSFLIFTLDISLLIKYTQ